MKRKVFRWLINTFDRVNLFVKDVLNIDAKRKTLEMKQNMIPVSELERTIGRALKVKMK